MRRIIKRLRRCVGFWVLGWHLESREERRMRRQLSRSLRYIRVSEEGWQRGDIGERVNITFGPLPKE